MALMAHLFKTKFKGKLAGQLIICQLQIYQRGLVFDKNEQNICSSCNVIKIN